MPKLVNVILPELALFILPLSPDKGFQQIRYYGFYSNKCKTEPDTGLLFTPSELAKMAEDNTWAKGLWKSFGYDPTWCKCGARMEINYDLSDFRGGYG